MTVPCVLAKNVFNSVISRSVQQMSIRSNWQIVFKSSIVPLLIICVLGPKNY